MPQLQWPGSDTSTFLLERAGVDAFEPRGIYAFSLADGKCASLLDVHNRRLKVFDVVPEHFFGAADVMRLIGQSPRSDLMSKLTLYSRARSDEHFRRFGFSYEAQIQGFYERGRDAYIYARYDDAERSFEPKTSDYDQICDSVRSRGIQRGLSIEGDVTTRLAQPEDGPLLSTLLGTCFADYPTSLDAGHLAGLIEDRCSHFRIAFDRRGAPLACASIELDHQRRNAEVTDCATLPAARGQGVMSRLMLELELDARDIFGVRDLFTIARANEASMNRAFAKLGYRYTGRLIHNCRMPTGWESMNVWCRRVESAE